MRSAIAGLLLLILSHVQVHAADAKFSKGDSFQYVNIDGSLTIECSNKIKTVTCRDVFLDPWPYDVFIGPKNVNAQNVELRSTVGNESYAMVASYDGRSGRSEDINLGVYSLFQKPLLKVGENNIRYVLLGKNNTVLETDTFNVSVTRGKSRSCEPKETSTNNPQDCEHTYTLCQLYFRNQNYCNKN